MKRVLLLLICLLAPTLAWAFPSTSVLDTFDSLTPGTTPPTANWTNGWIGAGTGQLQAIGNGAAGVVLNSAGDAYWSLASFGANCEAFVTIVAISATGQHMVGCRLQDIGTSTTDGYAVAADKATNKLIVMRRTNGSNVLQTTFSRTITAGDSFGIRTIGTQICAWYKTSAGSWYQVGCLTDSVYPNGGRIGLLARGDNTASQLDNFGGGTVVLCGGQTSPTLTAPALDQNTVNDCILAAATGDTINLPAGTATWVTYISGAASVSVNKGITLHGETTCSGSPVTCVDSTIINDGTGIAASSDPMSITGTNARVTGISFKDPRVVTVPADIDSKPEVTMNCANCRFDHNSIIDAVQPTTGTTHGIVAQSKTDSSTLIDHNYFKDLNGAINPDGRTGAEVPPGSASWATAMTLGDANAVYIEDNNIDFTAGTVLNGAYDSYAGGRAVFRFNTVASTNVGGHGLDSGSFRSMLRQEVYRNTFTNLGSHVAQLFVVRGGTYLFWQNTISASGGSYDAFTQLSNYRSDHTGSGWGICDGTQAKDGNTTAQEGYPCRDQVGRGPETASATDWPTIASPPNPSTTFSEPLVPGYSWGNLFKGVAPTITNISITDSGVVAGETRVDTFHILNNRDFYVEVPSFDGTAGTGTGTLAARPATCTTGVGYFATDQGSWNASGADGLFYKCTATNTWTLYYTPYTYPHPLQAVTVTAPTGLRLVTQPSANSVCLIWTASDMADLAGYRIYHGTAPSSYTLAADIPLNSMSTRHVPDTQYCYTSPVGGTHYFSMTAYNSDIVESSLATEVSATFTALSRTTASARGGSSTRDPLQ